MNKDSSWGKVADWYDTLLADKDSYQSKVILPNLLRLMNLSSKDAVVDIACGQGFFSRQFAESGARVSGCDISPELINIAQQPSVKSRALALNFLVASADKLPYENNKFDKAAIVLALQNIEQLQGMVTECARVLKASGLFYIVLNHPTFRIPKRSSWGLDEKLSIQYRRLDGYMSESSEEIIMNPGKTKSGNEAQNTLSFHRPLQVYVKALSKAGFAITRLEEWISYKQSQKGKRSAAEDRARKEIPLFLCIEAKLL